MTKVVRESSPQTPADLAAPARKRFGWLRVVGFLVCVAVVVAGFLPQLAGMVCQSPAALAWASGQPAGTIQVGRANFSWQGPVELKNVTLQNADGRPLANVASLTSELTFWDLLTRKVAPLKLKLSGIRLTVTVPDPGEASGELDLVKLNEELQFFKLPRPDRPIELTLTDCHIVFENEQHEVIDEWSNITANYKFDDANGKPTQGLQATLPADADRGRGELHLKAGWELETAGAGQLEKIAIQTTGDRVSLAAADSWFRKYLGPQHGLTSGSGELQAGFQRDRDSGWNLQATAHLNQLPMTPNLADAGGAPPSPASLEVQGQYSKASDEISVSRLYLAADDAAIDLRGTLKDLAGQQILDVKAEVQTPGSALMDLLPLEIRKQIQIQGMKFSQISIQGPLRPAADGSAQPLSYSLVASWDSALAYGLSSTQGQMQINYRDGLVSAIPLNVPVNGGRLVQFPSLDLRTEPATIHFQTGAVLENVKLTEEICRSWLRYISPTLADATAADGRLSLALNAGQLQLEALDRAELSGVVAIREGTVRPGPLAIQILQQVSQLQVMLNRGGDDLTQRAFLTMRQEDIPFRMHQGRIYHENFGANVGEMRVTTAGSVGLDQTLGLNLNIAFPEKWLANDRPVLQALAGQPITLGITGTFNEPRIDASRMADFGKQIGIKAGVGLIEKLIERRQQRNR